MPESDLWKKIKQHLSLDFMERVENRVGIAWPDVYYFHNNESGWIELKSDQKMPKRIQFRKGQSGWLQNYATLGGNCYLFQYVKSEKLVYVWDGIFARELDDPKIGPRKIKPDFVFTPNSSGFDDLYDFLFVA